MKKGQGDAKPERQTNGSTFNERLGAAICGDREGAPSASLCHSGAAHPKSRSYCYMQRDYISLQRHNFRCLWVLGKLNSRKGGGRKGLVHLSVKEVYPD